MDEEQLRAMEIRGDALVFMLNRNTTQWVEHAARLTELAQSLNTQNVPMTTPDGKETKAALLIKALQMLAHEATAAAEMNHRVEEEVQAIADEYNVLRTLGEAVDLVVELIRRDNPKYGAMTPDEVKRELKLETETDRTH